MSSYRLSDKFRAESLARHEANMAKNTPRVTDTTDLIAKHFGSYFASKSPCQIVSESLFALESDTDSKAEPPAKPQCKTEPLPKQATRPQPAAIDLCSDDECESKHRASKEQSRTTDKQVGSKRKRVETREFQLANLFSAEEIYDSYHLDPTTGVIYTKCGRKVGNVTTMDRVTVADNCIRGKCVNISFNYDMDLPAKLESLNLAQV